jgi:hypothetical protein
MREPANAPKGFDQVVEQLPEGLVPGGFERAFCQVFRAEIEAHQEKRRGSCPVSSPSGSRA